MGLSLAAVLAFAGRRYVWQALANPLFYGDAPEKADILYVLGGDYQMRGALAARLLRERWAPEIVFAREWKDPRFQENQSDLLLATLRKEGVKAEQITQLTTPGGVSSTAAEMRELKRYAMHHPMNKVLVVTSTFHGRRARMAAERALQGTGLQVRVVTGESHFASRAGWQTNDVGRLQVHMEIVKMVYYFFTFYG